MTYISLPNIVGNPWANLDCVLTAQKPEPYISFSLLNYLTEIKNKIENVQQEWDIYKKYTNPYEFIHCSQQRFLVSKYKPISRAYFKMLEIINTFNLFDNKKWKVANKEPIKMFALAEGPGGFIEAVCNYRQGCDADTIIGMTIENNDDVNVPGWKKTMQFLKMHPQVQIEKGTDNTGNLLCIDNFRHVAAKYKNSMDLVTADGGFDFTADFNNQELIMLDLLYAQIAYALCLLKRGGNFVLKIFDIFHKPTAELIYLLASFFGKVHIIKPYTSRYANSEKYLVCMDFKYDTCDAFMSTLEATFLKMLDRGERHISGFFRGKQLPIMFYNKLEECNILLGHTQIENIYNTLVLIENKNKSEKIDCYIKSHTSKCIHWCIKHGLEYYNKDG